jgi:Flp pilus assembly protein TadB
MTNEEIPPSAEGLPLSLEIFLVCVWSIWILAFLAGAWSNQSPLYWSSMLVAAVGSIVAACWRYIKRRRKSSLCLERY